MSDQPQLTFTEASQIVRLNVRELMISHERLCRDVVEMIEQPTCTLRMCKDALDGVAGHLAFIQAPIQMIDHMSRVPLADAGFDMMLGKLPQSGDTDRG